MVTKKTRVLDVVYNASNNELVRTKTLVKNSIVQIDSSPFRQWYENHYHTKLVGKGGKVEADAPVVEEKKQSKHLQHKIEERKAKQNLDPRVADVSTVTVTAAGVCLCSSLRG